MNGVRNQVMLGLVALGLVGAPAAAQDKEFDRPLSRSKERAVEDRAVTTQTRIVTIDGDDQFEVTINNGEVSAKVNGKKVPAERIRRSRDKIEILDKSGAVLKSFDVAGTDAGEWRGRTALRGAEPGEAKPRVMIGITMSDDEDGILVDHVYEGLPAGKAGLKERDVIIQVDGTGNLDQQSFRDALSKKEPGDKVQLKVRRDGQERDITIEVQKFDSEKLGAGPAMVWRHGELGDMENMFQNNPEAMKRFKDAMKMFPEGQRAFVWGAGPEEDFKFTPFGGAEAKRADELHAQMEKKIAELDKKLARINDQMARLEQLIQKLAEKDGGR